MFGVRDAKVRERLLRETRLTLAKTDDICHAAESTSTQLKMFEDNSGGLVNVIRAGKDQTTKLQGSTAEGKPIRHAGIVVADRSFTNENYALYMGRRAPSVTN